MKDTTNEWKEHYMLAFLTRGLIASWLNQWSCAHTWLFSSLINVWHGLFDRSFTLNKEDLVCLFCSSWVDSLSGVTMKKLWKKLLVSKKFWLELLVWCLQVCEAALFFSRCCPWPRDWLHIWIWRSKWVSLCGFLLHLFGLCWLVTLIYTP